MNSRLDDLKQKVSSNAHDPRAHFELGCAAQSQGDLELAHSCFTKVTQLAETVAVGHFNLGNVCFNLKRWPEAIAAFERAFQLSPDRSTLNNLGNSWAAMGDFEQAIGQYELALTLPDDGTGTFRVLKNLGTARHADGDRQGAVSAYQRAIDEPADTSSVFLQLTKLWSQTDFRQAMLALESRATQVRQTPELLAVQADCLASQYSLAEALQSLMQACDLAPDHPTVLASLGRHYLLRGRHFESLVCLHRALTGGELSARTHSAWLSSQLYQEPIDWERFKHEAERWSDVAQVRVADEVSKPSTLTSQPAVESTLHLGIVGGATAYKRLELFLQPLIEHAAAQNYRLSLYIDGDVPVGDMADSGVSDSDADIAQGRHDSPYVRWIDSRWLGDNRLSRMIRSDAVDVLIDLTGHSDDGRLGVCATRAAPLQISWAGWLATTGLKAMDLVVADRTTLLDSERPAFTEEVVSLPGCMFCVIPLASPMRRVEELSSAVFGAVCSPTQLADKLVSTWCKLLRQMPNAKLKLADPAYRDVALANELAEKFRTREVEVGRIEFTAPENIDEFLQSIHVTLDPFPWNRAEVTGRSLCLGTPVVAWRGDRMSSRTSASVLKAAGVDQWIAESPDAYCQLAQSVVQDRIAPAELNRRVTISSLCDTAVWVREFMAQLRLQQHRSVNKAPG